MRTSPTQFEIMVAFMERNGDLNKPAADPQGRIAKARLWESLRDVLNQDITGETKTTEKWRKVWSDLKNNVNRKAARIKAGVTGTGGGPACTLQLTDLESRVIRNFGRQAATGITSVTKIGLAHHAEPQKTPLVPHVGSKSLNDESISVLQHHDLIIELIDQKPHRAITDVPANKPQPSYSAQIPRRPGPNVRGNVSLQRLPYRRRGIRRLLRSSHLRRRTHQPTHENQAERAASQFLQSERAWRQFRMKHHAEERRLRDWELELQERWLDLMNRFMETTERLLNRLFDVED